MIVSILCRIIDFSRRVCLAYSSEVCLADKKVFLHEQTLYSPKDISRHTSQGDPGDQSVPKNGHPLCKFCNKNFFSSDELYYHMERTHLTCDMCTRNGVLYQYFGSYESLVRISRLTTKATSNQSLSLSLSRLFNTLLLILDRRKDILIESTSCVPSLYVSSASSSYLTRPSSCKRTRWQCICATSPCRNPRRNERV